MPRARRYGSKYASKRRFGAKRAKPKFSLKRIIKRTMLATTEDKYSCVDTGPQSLTSGTWYTTKAFSIPQGDSSSARDGNAIMGNYGKIRMSLVSPTDRVAYVRVLLIRWKGANGAFNTADLPTDHLACITPSMRNNYSIIRDMVITMNPRTTGAAEDSRVMFRKIFFRDRNKKLFDGTTLSAEKGQVYFCVLHGSNFGSGTDDPEVDAQIEYHFKDV